MSNTIYPKALESFLGGAPAIDWDSDTIKAMLVKSAQAYSANHQYVDDLTAGNIVARSSALASKTKSLGVGDAADITFTAVPANDPCIIVLYKDTGDDTTSPLIAFLDTGTGLPKTPTGNDIIIAWSTDGILSLA